jgi:hypothetical protein
MHASLRVRSTAGATGCRSRSGKYDGAGAGKNGQCEKRKNLNRLGADGLSIFLTVKMYEV